VTHARHETIVPCRRRSRPYLPPLSTADLPIHQKTETETTTAVFFFSKTDRQCKLRNRNNTTHIRQTYKLADHNTSHPVPWAK